MQILVGPEQKIFGPVQTEDNRHDIIQFKSIADTNVTEEISDINCKHFFEVTNKCLQRYTKRPTANEVCYIALLLFLVKITSGPKNMGISEGNVILTNVSLILS